jgi:hypothetical protein
MDEYISSETKCKGPHCTRMIAQVGSGHRKREYCNDNCRQAAQQARREAGRRKFCVEQVQAWGSFQAETMTLLAGLLYAGNEEYARSLAAIIRNAQGDQDAREKLTQAARRIAKLERQVDIQRQQLGQYHQRFYPSSLAVAVQRLMALGAAINYKILATVWLRVTIDSCSLA